MTLVAVGGGMTCLRPPPIRLPLKKKQSFLRTRNARDSIAMTTHPLQRASGGGTPLGRLETRLPARLAAGSSVRAQNEWMAQARAGSAQARNGAAPQARMAIPSEQGHRMAVEPARTHVHAGE